ncbi:MAG: hypothetical protein GY801_50140 [bacterium]|nr:hypothetical protein [bacterium]
MTGYACDLSESSYKKEASDIVENLDFFPFPSREEGKGDPANVIGSPGQDYYSITTTCKSREMALEFLKSHIMDRGFCPLINKDCIFMWSDGI